MEKLSKQYFNFLKELIKQSFTSVKIVREIDYAEIKAIEIYAQYENYKIKIAESIGKEGRKYSYYILKSNKVLGGFDNVSDVNALKLKYGDKKYKKYRYEKIPHFHSEDKQIVSLTDEIMCEEFIKWVKEKIN